MTPTRISIDGRRVEATVGEYLLAVAKREGVHIPTLCHHEAVEPTGACRLCLVEVTRPQWKGWSKLVTACLYPVEEGLSVRTNSERVRKTRKEVLELLLARSPGSKELWALGREYGIVEPRYKVEELGDNCTLCDVCTRICQDLVTGAISRVNRGVRKVVSTPFAEVSDACIGCLACARSCPTRAIPFSETGGTRTIWGKTFELVPCSSCGDPTVTREQAAWLAGRQGVEEADLCICDRCKVVKSALVHRGAGR